MFRSLIDRNLNRAYNLVKDLAVTVSFVHKEGTEFNFGTGSVEHDSSASTSIKAVVLNSEKKSAKSSTMVKTIMFKTADIPDYSIYDEVIISGDTWKIGQPSKDDGSIIVLSIFREV